MHFAGENVLVKCESSSAMDGSSAELGPWQGSDGSMHVDEPPGWGLDRWVLYTDLVGSTVANCMMRRSLSFP